MEAQIVFGFKGLSLNLRVVLDGLLLSVSKARRGTETRHSRGCNKSHSLDCQGKSLTKESTV